MSKRNQKNPYTAKRIALKLPHIYIFKSTLNYLLIKAVVVVVVFIIVFVFPTITFLQNSVNISDFMFKK
jgi:hypothetical protein